MTYLQIKGAPLPPICLSYGMQYILKTSSITGSWITGYLLIVVRLFILDQILCGFLYLIPSAAGVPVYPSAPSGVEAHLEHGTGTDPLDMGLITGIPEPLDLDNSLDLADDVSNKMPELKQGHEEGAMFIEPEGRWW